MTALPQPGWYPDPTDATIQRWWNGTAWGTETAPLVGTSPPAQTFAAAAVAGPATASPGPDLTALVNTVKANPIFTDELRKSVHQRRPTPLVSVLAAGGGVLVGSGAITLFSGNGQPWSLVFIGVVLLGLGWGLSLLLKFVLSTRVDDRSTEFMPAATAIAVLGVYALVLGLGAASAVNAFNRFDLSPNVAWWPMLLASIVLFGLWLAPGLQGRPFLLGAALTSLGVAGALFFGVVTTTNFLRGIGPNSGWLDTGISNMLREGAAFTSGTIFFWGLLLMVAVLFLDAVGWKGFATPVLAAGWTSVILGLGFLALNPGVIIAMVLTLVLIVVMLVGGLGRRRATTWVGGALIPVALAAGVVSALAPRPNAAAVGVLLGFTGVVVLAMTIGVRVAGPRVRTWYEQFSVDRTRQLESKNLDWLNPKS